MVRSASIMHRATPTAVPGTAAFPPFVTAAAPRVAIWPLEG